MKTAFNKILEHIEALSLNTKSTFSIEDFCRYTGFSKSHAYKLTSNRKIPFSCPNGKTIFMSKLEVDKYLLSNPITPTEDIEQEAIDFVAGTSSRKELRW
jgi:excisionase family DNA binding protein